MKTLIFDPGTILIWKEYPKLKQLFSRITRKQLPYNRCTILRHSGELVGKTFFDKVEFKAFQPKKRYSTSEKKQLQREWESYYGTVNNIRKFMVNPDVLFLVNIVRPETIDFSTLDINRFETNKYYKEIYASKG